MSWQNPGVLGIDIASTHTTAQQALGTMVNVGGTVYQYIKATAALTQYFVYIINGSFEAASGVDQTNDDTAPISLGAPPDDWWNCLGFIWLGSSWSGTVPPSSARASGSRCVAIHNRHTWRT